MHRERTLNGIYAACQEEGSFVPKYGLNKEQVKTTLSVALTDWETARSWVKKAPKESGQWNALYKLHYDILHGLVETFLLCDKVKARTHECLFAYLCEKHPELELSWGFFEKIRTKRNGSLYYGQPLSYADWKEIEMQINLYLHTMKEAIEKALQEDR
ncbi:MAG TPA: hypothetical protein VJG31_03520 [Candidatus Nanoarchaeia archaeon]|nr:hypothetical protein [Candidatus Nanoarchaeia archaeon]